MRLSEIAQRSIHFTFHETSLAAAIQIVSSGRIKGIYVDNEEARRDLSNDLGVDYGNWVYTSTLRDDVGYFGVSPNEVMFVIDVSKLPIQGVHEPEMEGGLYAIPKMVPLSAIECVYIFTDEESDDVHKLSAMCIQKHVQFDWVSIKERHTVVAKYLGVIDRT